jgi:hypothetical protein
MEKLIAIIEKLENDFNGLDLNDQEAKDFFKDRSALLMPTIRIAKEAEHNFIHMDLLDSLAIRVVKIISQL